MHFCISSLEIGDFANLTIQLLEAKPSTIAQFLDTFPNITLINIAKLGNVPNMVTFILFVLFTAVYTRI
jgi:hypothetical protein